MSVEERITASDPLADPSGEENSDWVTVKKRKITILVPPAPTDDSQSKNSEPIRSKRNSKHSEGDLEDPAEPPSADRATSKAQEPHQSHAVSVGNETGSGNFITEPTSQLAPPNIQGDGSAVLCSSKTFECFRKPPIGTSTLVNRRLRALNLERKLQGSGGLRAWLSSQGLGRFVRVFEKEKIGKYQLANLTMSELKDMGIVAVGPRRKLIHAINGLCQPYYL